MHEITIRVYAFLVNTQNEVLLLDEKYGEHRFTKLPGGGLEPGYSVSNRAILFGLLVPGIPVQTVPLFWV